MVVRPGITLGLWIPEGILAKLLLLTDDVKQCYLDGGRQAHQSLKNGRGILGESEGEWKSEFTTDWRSKPGVG